MEDAGWLRHGQLPLKSKYMYLSTRYSVAKIVSWFCVMYKAQKWCETNIHLTSLVAVTAVLEHADGPPAPTKLGGEKFVAFVVKQVKARAYRLLNGKKRACINFNTWCSHSCNT